MNKEAIRGYENNDLPIYSFEDIKSLVLSGERVERFERIPLEKILYDQGIVEENHVKELTEQMKGPRGQLSPILVRVLLNKEKNDIYYDIADGYHRRGSFPLVPIYFPNANVLYNCPDEEFYEIRIIAANNIPCVKFSRMGKWLEESYSQSFWAKKGINFSQLLSLTATNTSGKRLGLTDEETKEAKEYCIKKAELWRVSVSTFAIHVDTIENSDPNLVKQVRELSGGAAGKKYLNVARLQAIASNLKDREKQIFAGELCTKHNLNKLETAIVANAMNYIDTNKTSNRDILLLNPLDVSKSILEENDVDVNKLVTNTYKAVYSEGSKNYFSFRDLEKENKILKRSLKELKKIKKGDISNSDKWWLTINDLSEIEKTIMNDIFCNFKTFEEIEYDYNLTINQLFSHMISVHRKFQIESTEDQIINKIKSLYMK